jgi:hypothetical protein
MEYFAALPKEAKPHETEKPNVKTSPSKKGTGYGYSNVTLSKFPEYKGDKYDGATAGSRVKTPLIFNNKCLLTSTFLWILLKDAMEKHKKSMVDGPFKAGMFHKVYFDKNPYLTEKDGAVYKPKSRSKSESDLKIFKPSSPPKNVS